jgi:hypothetical protein
VKTNSLINLFISGLIMSQSISLASIAQPSSAVLEDQSSVVGEKTSSLTQEIIDSIMKSIEKAEKEENVEQILELLAPHVFSSVTVELEDLTVTKVIEGKKAHHEFLTKSFTEVQEREVIRSYVTSKITSDNQFATVTRIKASDVDTDDGKSFFSVSTDKIRFAIIDNKPQIINIQIEGWLEQRPN